MLPSVHRMRSGADFTATVRDGRRAARPLLVVHVRRVDDPDRPTLVGFVVGRGVGDAVTRHRVTRRLRHQVRDLLAGGAPWRTGCQVVVRALPAAAGADAQQLHDDLVAALDRADRGRTGPAAPALAGRS